MERVLAVLLLASAAISFGQQTGGGGVPGSGSGVVNLASPGAIGGTTPNTANFTSLTSSGTDNFVAANFSGVATFNGTSIYNNPLQVSFSSSYVCGLCFNSSAAPSTYNTGWFTVTGGGSDLRAIAGGGFTFDIQSNNIQIEPSIPLEFNNTSYAPDLYLSHDTTTSEPILDIGASGSNSNGGIKAAGFMNGGTTFSVSGCGAATSLAGGATAGKFVGGSSTCSPVITMGGGFTATNGYACFVQDETTSTAVFRQTAYTPTTATLAGSGTIGATDTLVFSCIPF